MKGLGFIAVIVVVWLIFRNRSQAATTSANPLDSLIALANDPALQSDPMLITWDPSIDASQIPLEKAGLTPFDYNLLALGIEQPEAPARPNGG